MGKKKRNKRSHSKRTFYEKAGRRNRHHIKAKSRGGTMSPKNLILLDENKHAAFHLLFGLRTFREAASLLIRASEMKERQSAKKDVFTSIFPSEVALSESQ
jgi:hypothetical protein